MFALIPLLAEFFFSDSPNKYYKEPKMTSIDADTLQEMLYHYSSMPYMIDQSSEEDWSYTTIDNRGTDLKAIAAEINRIFNGYKEDKS